MNNFEKIKQMTVEEMAEFLDKASEECCYICNFNFDTCKLDADCQGNIKQWLLSEATND